MIHGTGSNFYGSKLLAALESRLTQSAAVLHVNTRGHDLVTFGGAPPKRWLGAALERVDEAPLDLAAWVTLVSDPSAPAMFEALLGRGYRRKERGSATGSASGSPPLVAQRDADRRRIRSLK